MQKRWLGRISKDRRNQSFGVVTDQSSVTFPGKLGIHTQSGDSLLKKEIQRIFVFQVPELLQAVCFILIHSGYWTVILLKLFKDNTNLFKYLATVFSIPRTNKNS